MRRLVEQSKRDGEQSGQIMIMFAAALIVLLGFAALAVDVGFLLAERRGIQNASDAAAMAAARHIARGNDAGSAITVGESYAELNGYPENGQTTVTVTPNGTTVEAVVEHEVESFFLQALYTGDWGVSSRAVAEIITDPGPFAMIALNDDPNCQPTQSGINFSGTGNNAATINIVGAGDNPASIGSNACIVVNGNPDIYVDGNVEAKVEIVENGQNSIEYGGDFKSGTLNEIPNPFEDTDPPTCDTPGTMIEDPDDSNRVILTPGFYDSKVEYKEIYVTPGVYCFQKRVKVGASGIMQSVDLEVDQQTLDDLEDLDPAAADDLKRDLFDDVDDEPETANGGVVLYFEGNQGTFQASGGAKVKVRAAGVEGYTFPNCGGACDANIVVWMSEPGCKDFAVNGNVENEVVGVIYAPCSKVGMGGTSNNPVFEGMIVAKTVDIYGTATLNLIADLGPDGEPTRVFLVE